MTRLLPKGLISIHDATLIVQEFRHAGTAESSLVRELKSKGLSVGSREEQTAARAQIRKWILEGRLRLHATGGVRGKDIVLSPTQVGMIPGLKTLSVADLSYLRSSHPLHKQFVGWFGSDLSVVALGVEEKEIRQLGRSIIMRSRRRPQHATSAGRPAVRGNVEMMVRETVEAGKWSPIKSLKELTQLVNRKRKPPVSYSTVRRAIDNLYLTTGDRRFRRIPREERRTD